MSIEDTNPVESIPDNLDDFEAALWPKEASSEPASSEVEDQEVEDDRDASEDTEDTQSLDNETDDSDVDASDDDDDGESDEADEEPQDSDEEPADEKPAKKKKNRFQERIDEVVGKQREAERRLEEALAELERLKNTQQNPEPDPASQDPVTDNTGPAPTDLNEDGTQKYPLGEFDPQYIKDLMRHTLDTERAAREAEEERTKREREVRAAQAELETSWAEKLAPAQERYPDFQEKGLNLVETFQGIEPEYGEYLQTTLMSMEHGPDVLYYLANNVDEAQKIVNSGPRLATIALGRIEAKFAMAAEEKQRARPKVSQAPEPPAVLNKGSGVTKAPIKGDEDDLEAFSRALFKK